MTGGDSSSSSAREGPRKKLKQKHEEQEEKGPNPLDPRFSDYDPKEGDYVLTRFQHPTLDLHMECTPTSHFSSPPPCRYMEGTLSFPRWVPDVNIVSSDYGYPLNVYGTIIARDSLDHKCIYLFRRGKDSCQNISSMNDPLVLTGPKRGLMIFDSIIFEVDLKVNDVNGRKVNDKRVSRGLMEINGIFRLSFPPKYIVQTKKLVSMHSTLDLNYTFVRKAVEGTIEMRILEAGPVNFHGKIIARTSSFPCDIMLHDSKLAGMLTAGEDGILQTARRVVSVSVDETLLLTVAIAADGVYTVEFTPKRGGYDEERIAWGDIRCW
ncbi:hypothetical protein ZWY2020_046246 [Hordeum vulgare]|nr:hypothetical protein ZWY2020_046246 [Hordeum vulgare]